MKLSPKRRTLLILLAFGNIKARAVSLSFFNSRDILNHAISTSIGNFFTDNTIQLRAAPSIFFWNLVVPSVLRCTIPFSACFRTLCGKLRVHASACMQHMILLPTADGQGSKQKKATENSLDCTLNFTRWNLIC